MKTLRDRGDVDGKRVLVRVDVNVPLADGAVAELSLRSAADRLAELTGADVTLAPGVVGGAKVSDKIAVIERFREGVDLQLPVDLVAGERFAADAEVTPVDSVDVPDGLIGLDIRPRTGQEYVAIQRFGYTDRVTHLSAGGGAALELIEGKPLPGVEALA